MSASPLGRQSSGGGRGRRLPGPAGRQAKGWWRADRWLVLRRASQLAWMGVFLSGPLLGVWIFKGNLSASMLLDVVPFTDLLLFLQTLATGQLPARDGLLGAALVLLCYLLVGGRVFCSWVCPVNLVTDAADWMRPRLGLRRGTGLARGTRYWVLGAVLLLAALSGQLMWETVNPVTLLPRGLLFGMGAGWLVVGAIFLLDLLLLRQGWCGRLCPTGALYGLLSPVALVRVDASRRELCDDCQDCYQVCPEPQVLGPALKGAEKGVGPTIVGVNCTNCGRCIDVCPQDVFEFALHLPDQTRVAR